MDKNKSKPAPACGSCNLERKERVCIKENGRGAKGCPTLTYQETLEEANREYASEGWPIAAGWFPREGVAELESPWMTYAGNRTVTIHSVYVIAERPEDKR